MIMPAEPQIKRIVACASDGPMVDAVPGHLLGFTHLTVESRAITKAMLAMILQHTPDQYA